MKQQLWLPFVTFLAYCIDKELCKAIDYLREQVRVVAEHQKNQDKRIRMPYRVHTHTLKPETIVKP